ncbi:glycerate kinase [Limosilactobacillus ingluviei]|uniref:glycerate kinase n=1 Tax=Limosilactobacillus ingluviei TaxID=148604 RepID=UPI0024BACB99|nr:glycerate kinase [Limosilactobacillus ingluviei]
MKIVIAPDSFKGSLTAKEVGEAIQAGLKQVWPDAEYVLVPMADGGEGTVQALVDATGGCFVTRTVTGPLGLPVAARYGLLGQGQTAVIEMAAASGLPLVPADQLNPLLTTTYGTGELVRDALDQGVREIILGLGGSATNDGGAGLAQALGAHLLDQSGQELPFGGGALGELAQIDVSQLDPRLSQVKIKLASDVTNPLTGPQGATAVFGPQKGATPAMVTKLEANLRHYAAQLQTWLGQAVAQVPGAGAAGGLGAGLLAFTHASLHPGVELVVAATNLKRKAHGADLAFTGEGSLDFQTRFGKTPYGVAQAIKAVAPHAPVIALTGHIGPGGADLTDVIDAVFATPTGAKVLTQAMAEAKADLEITATQIARLWEAQQKNLRLGAH